MFDGQSSGRQATAACVCVVVVCQLLLGGLYALLRLKRKWASSAEIGIMALGVGTLIADAMMHVIPDAIGGHDHGSGGHDHGHGHDHSHGGCSMDHSHSPEGGEGIHSHVQGVLLGLTAIGGMIFVILLEAVVHGIQHQSHAHHQGEERRKTRASLAPITVVPADSSSLDSKLVTKIAAPSAGCGHHETVVAAAGGLEAGGCTHRRSDAQCEAHHHHHHGFAHFFEDDPSDVLVKRGSIAASYTDVLGTAGKACHGGSHEVSGHRHADVAPKAGREQRMFAASLVYVCAKVVHDIIDGFTIGIAFQGGLGTGIATSICILIHELPMQFADVIMLLKGGFRPPVAVGINFLVALVLIPGAWLAQIGGSGALKPYLLMGMAGNFICLAFSQLLPEIRESILDYQSSKSGLTAWAVVCGGCGVVIIALLGIFEPPH